LVITRGGTYPLTPVIFAAIRLDILSPCGLLVPSMKKRDSMQSKAAKQAWCGCRLSGDRPSRTGFSLSGFDLCGDGRSQKKTG
jgi:hypothetical protein